MNNDLGGYVTHLALNDGTILSLNKDDIVVFVGPNNSGKSQALRDISACCEWKCPFGVVVRNIGLKTSTTGLEELLRSIAVYEFDTKKFCYAGFLLDKPGFNDADRFGEYAAVFVSFLKTDERLSYCMPRPNFDKGDKITHPIQYLVKDKAYLFNLSDLFNKVFQLRLYCYSKGKNISLRVGLVSEEIVGQNRMDIAQKFDEDVSNLPHLEKQGDGMRSFVSIFLSIGLKYKRIHLLDEPESFLHQTQTRIVGRMLGEELSNNQQAFISTHSTSFLKGLLETAESRVKIIRITRVGDTNHFHILDNNSIKDICSDAMLKHTNILEGLFSNKVVVCESDVDCQMYSSIEEHLANKMNHYSESLYLYTGGKSSFKKTLSALIGLGIDYTAVLDLDVLDDVSVIKGIYEVCGGSWREDVEGYYNVFLEWAKTIGKGTISKQKAKEVLFDAISECKNDPLSPRDIRNIKTSLNGGECWKEIKRKGRMAISDEKVLGAFDSMLSCLAEKGIFLVPCGEIESFFPGIDRHSNGWLQSVYTQFPSFDMNEYDELKNFVRRFLRLPEPFDNQRENK